ncbi:MAG: T9SS type A sorting domain-containing protein [Bacteroidota bacterium]
MLGLVGTPAAEAQIPFVEQVPSPFELGPFAETTTPVLADFDGDGDLNVIISFKYGPIVAYENTGTPEAPAFRAVADTTIIGSGTGFSDASSPVALGDLDGDGDLDGILSNQDGSLRYFENTGTPERPVPRERTGTANPLLNVTVPLSQIAFVDLDDDGDLDLAGASANYEGYGGDGFLSYYENTGSATVPAFAQRTGATNPFDGIRGSGLTLGDGDSDGDLDLVAAIDRDDSVDNVRGFLNVYRNVGTSTAPRFRQVPDARNPFADIEDNRPRPFLMDLDGDNDLDLALGTSLDGVRYFENVLPAPGAGLLGSAAIVAAVARPTVLRDGDGALLTWTHTGPNATYEVHRLFGTTGAFDLLGTVAATNGQELRFHTGPLGDGTVQLRLRRVENDGRSAYGPTAVAQTGIAGTHTLSAPYPNPTPGRAQFVLTAAEAQSVQARIYDLSGRHVADVFAGALEAGLPRRFVVGDGLGAGAYVLRVTGEHFQDAQRFTVVPR